MICPQVLPRLGLADFPCLFLACRLGTFSPEVPAARAKRHPGLTMERQLSIEPFSPLGTLNSSMGSPFSPLGRTGSFNLPRVPPAIVAYRAACTQHSVKPLQGVEAALGLPSLALRAFSMTASQAAAVGAAILFWHSPVVHPHDKRSSAHAQLKIFLPPYFPLQSCRHCRRPDAYGG